MSYESSTVSTGRIWSIGSDPDEAQTSGDDAWSYGLDALATALVAHGGPRWSPRWLRRDRRKVSGRRPAGAFRAG